MICRKADSKKIDKMAEEFFTGCIRPINAEEICDGENANFWFDSPLRFGVWGYLKDRLPAYAAKFATCESKSRQPERLICAAEAILLSDLFLTDSFGVVVYGTNSKSNFGEQENGTDNEISILIRVFAPAEISEDNCKIVDMNILAMCAKRLLSDFTSDDLWKFEPTAKQAKQQVQLIRIESRSSDSGGALVRAAREFIDMTAVWKVIEELPEQNQDWIE